MSNLKAVQTVLYMAQMKWQSTFTQLSSHLFSLSFVLDGGKEKRHIQHAAHATTSKYLIHIKTFVKLNKKQM